MKSVNEENIWRRLVSCVALVLLSCMLQAQDFEYTADPTIATDAMAARLRSLAAESDAMRMYALVVGVGDSGVALVGEEPTTARVVRGGSVASVILDGMMMDVLVRRVTANGVELGIPGEREDADGVMLSGTFAPLPEPTDHGGEFLRHLEATKAPLNILTRLIADQTGVNIAVSDSAAEKDVSIFLRNVTADEAVEEICRATNLWFRREKGSNIIRVMSMEEYSDNLNTFREESTEMFTLLYPNVVEVASVIFGLYPDRTFLSLGEEEFDEDDEYDLGRRFRRFRVLEENGGSQFMSMEAPQVSSSGTRAGSGNFSFSRGNATSRLSQWDELRRRSRRRSYGLNDDIIGYDDAAAMEAAYRAGDTNSLDKVRAQATAATANIFVTLSRRNNILIVRTSDSRVMDEIRSLVKRLDVPTPMVLMEVKVLELSVDDDYEASFTYSFNRGTHTVGHNGDGTANIFSDILQGGQNTINPTFAFKVVSDNITAQIQLMQRDGKIRTLATPTLLVANNEVARIFSGKQYPIVTGWTPGSTTPNDVGAPTIVPSTPNIERRDVGTMLLITPNINADKTVTLRLLQENSDISPETAMIPVIDSATGSGGDKAVQYVESRSLTGTFVANDGMTIMAGGLVKESEGETYWRTPFLGSIPLIGWLFRGTEKVRERTELIVLIKPHVILTPIEGGKISEDVMKALSAHPAADGRDSMGTHKPDEPHTPADDIKNIAL